MGDPPRFGLMATISDIDAVQRLGADFIELLVREGDDIGMVEKVLSPIEGEVIIHAPERMRFDDEVRLLDLADTSAARRKMAVDRIAELSEMAARHESAMVVHPGGLLRERLDDASVLKRNLTDSLSSLDGELWIENMPRGYHYEGKLWHPHLLLHAEDFDDVLPLVNGVTVDICHAYLSVERGGNGAIAAFFRELKGAVRHIHLSDASYPHNEGLPLGEGDIDMSMLPRMGGLPVLLEVRDGHLNGMAGHREALRAVRERGWFKGCIP